MVQAKKEKKMVVSDAMAKNSRQLLNAHIYNYLIENGRYETAKQFLLEADVPLSEERSDTEETADVGVRQKAKGEANADLLPASMMMNCAETFLHEWWECFNSLQRFVDNTPLEELKENRTREAIVPLVSFNPEANTSTGSRIPTAPQVPVNRSPNGYPQQVPPSRSSFTGSNMPMNGQHANYDPHQNMAMNAYPQDNVQYSLQPQPQSQAQQQQQQQQQQPQAQLYQQQFPQQPRR